MEAKYFSQFFKIKTVKIWYRRSSDSADSISAVLGLVRIENRTTLPKFLNLVRIYFATTVFWSYKSLCCAISKWMFRTKGKQFGNKIGGSLSAVQ